jgi:hypothetical protein
MCQHERRITLMSTRILARTWADFLMLWVLA